MRTSMTVRASARWYAIGLGLLLWLTAVKATAMMLSAAPPTTLPPPYLGVSLASGQFLLPISATGAVDLQDWTFDLKFDATVVQPAYVGDWFLSAFGAEFNGATLQMSEITSAGFDLGGVLEGVAGFSSGVNGDGLLAFLAFEFLEGQTGQNPGFEVITAPPPQTVPEPATALLLLGALGVMQVGRVRRAGRQAMRVLCAATIAAGAVLPAGAQPVANGSYYATPSWNQTLPAPSRFIVLSNFNSEAVLDRETGLIWQRAPNPGRIRQLPPPGSFGGTYADDYCNFNQTGGRMGWRLPSVSELTSLIDPSQKRPALPPGHPFQLSGNPDAFWTSTVYYPERYATARRIVDIVNGTSGAVDGGDSSFPVWCVRAGAPSTR